jgi:hypothetical protein
MPEVDYGARVQEAIELIERDGHGNADKVIEVLTEVYHILQGKVPAGT